MITDMKKKLIDIESVLFTPNPVELVEVENTFQTPSITRHSSLRSNDINAPYNYLISEMRDTVEIAKNYERLLMFFYNTREGQLQSLQERYEVLELRKRILASFSYGIQKSIIALNDKTLFGTAGFFGQDESGLWFPYVSQVKLTPSLITKTNDSNVRIGVLQNEFQNSKLEALWTDDQNDLFSINREDTEDLFISFIMEFEKAEIINEVELEYISKPNQIVKVTIVDTATQEILFDKDIKDFWLSFSRPTKTKSLLFKISATGIGRNQLDLKKLGFYKRKYKQEMSAKTIKISNLSNKLLTLENVVLTNEQQKNFLDISVTANGETLSSLNSGNPPVGPFRDPEFNLTVKINNTSKILDYLDVARYKVSKGLPMDILDFKIVRPVLTEAKSQTFSIIEGANSVFFEIGVPDLEDLIDIYLNGVYCTRALSSEPLTGNKYQVIYTGTGYTIRFLTLPVNSSVTLNVRSMPCYITDKKIGFPASGLGREVKYMYGTSVNSVRLAPFLGDNRTISTGYKDIQKVIFKNGLNQELTYIEKEPGSTLAGNQYSVDRTNGQIYVSNSYNATYIDIFYLKTKMNSVLVEFADREALSPQDIETFTYSGSLKDLLAGNIPVYTLVYNTQENAFLSSDKRGVQLPKHITLHKNSVFVGSKREVLFVDGFQEIFRNGNSEQYFDFNNKDAGVYKFIIRDLNVDLDSFYANTLTVDNLAFTRKVASLAELTLEGDYFFDSSNLYLKSIIDSLNSILVKVEKREDENVFSVDYVNNRIYTNSLDFPDLIADSIANSIEFTGLLINSAQPTDLSSPAITFSYSAIKVIDFSIDLELPLATQLKESDHFLYVYNGKDVQELLPYFTPILENLEIGIFE